MALLNGLVAVAVDEAEPAFPICFTACGAIPPEAWSLAVAELFPYAIATEPLVAFPPEPKDVEAEAPLPLAPPLA